jgi:hypothetical protein
VCVCVSYAYAGRWRVSTHACIVFMIEQTCLALLYIPELDERVERGRREQQRLVGIFRPRPRRAPLNGVYFLGVRPQVVQRLVLRQKPSRQP